MMKTRFVAVLLACWLAACAQSPASQQQVAPPPAPATPPPEAPSSPAPRVTSEAQIAPGRWDVDQVRCSDLLGADDDDRAAAIMFY
jgi:anti-sigma factor ChrR (cupin superfamily)